MIHLAPLQLLILVWLVSVRTHGIRTRTGSGGPEPLEYNGTVAVAVTVDLSSVTHRVDQRFLSVTIDASLATEEKFMYLLGSPKLRTMARALAPGFVRFGGTRQDFMVFSPQRRSSGVHSASLAPPTCDQLLLPHWLERRLTEAWTQQQEALLKEELQRKYRRVKFTETTVDLLHDFANCSGLQLIFGLNALLRTPANVWNGSNARTLLQYAESRGYRMHWELGNEPNSFEKKAGVRVDGVQLGRDFARLREMMSQSQLYRGAGLFGPDVGQPRDHRVDILEGFLQTGAEAVDAVTWHHYYVNGRDTSLEDFLDPEVLDTLILKTNEVLEKVDQVSPGKAVWLGETSSAYGGGAPGLSDTFAAGFMWLDKLGLAARLRLDVVMRQVLVGSGFYHLVDDDLNPLPDFWLSVLYKRLVGPEVLKVSRDSERSSSKRVRVYLHCSNNNSYRPGAVTLVTMNLGRRTSRVSSPSLVSSSSTVEAFVLQAETPGDEGLYSRRCPASHGNNVVNTVNGRNYDGSVDLSYSDVLYRDLSRGLEALMLNSYLHLVYLVTPYDLVAQVKPDWMVYFRQFTLLSVAEQKMSAAVGVAESFVARKAAGQTVKNSADAAVVGRMYLALVLFSLLKETDLWLVSSRFQLSRGFVQTLLSSSSAFCSCVLHFTQELEELWPFRALLTELTRRLSYCVKAELVPLMEVTGVMECRAKQLYDAGYKTLTHLANADPALLSRSIENLYKKQANQIVASAKMLLSEKASALQEEVDELLALPTDLPTAEGAGPHG